MIYQEYPPSEHLKNIVFQYWLFKTEADDQKQFPIQHITLPDNCASIVVIRQPYFQGVRLLGPHTQKLEQTIYPNSIYLGVRLLPWLRFTPMLFDKKEILNTTASATPIITASFEYLIDDLEQPVNILLQKIEKQLLLLLNTFHIAHNDIVKYICLELDKGVSIATIVDEVPFSIRVIQKKFKADVGFTMQQYANTNRQRKLWTQRLREGDDIKQLIYDYNFYDQAHFINHFKKIMKVPHSVFEAYHQQIDLSLE